MVKILLTDDDPDKIRKVMEELKSIPGTTIEAIDVAHTVQEAKVLLRDNQYDLLILDIALPERSDTDPSPEAGIGLLRELSERTTYRKPREIIGLTAYPEAFVQANPKFAEELWHVIQFDGSSENWASQLKKKIKYIQLSLENPAAAKYESDLCVIVALRVPEFNAVLDLAWDWKDLELPQEVLSFKEGIFRNRGESRRVLSACSDRMGITAAAILGCKMIYNFRPRYLAMVGIAAGFKGLCRIGDILVADPTWDFESGKWVSSKEGREFEPAPHQLDLNPRLRSRFQTLADDQARLDEIKRQWRGNAPDSTLKMHIAPLASGASVRADGAVKSDIFEQHRKALGLDMEAYGIMAAAHEAPLPEVKAFTIKSVSDFADSKKEDIFQAYAAYTSAAALRIFAEEYLPF